MKYPEFPREEYIDRSKKLCSEMEKLNIDGIIITNADNIRYFAGGPLTELFDDHFNFFFLIIPTDISVCPVIIMSTGREGTSKTSWIEDRRFWGYGSTGSVMEQEEWVVLLKKTLEDKRLLNKRIGMEMSMGFQMGLPQMQFKQLEKALDSKEIIDGSSAIWATRVIKSENEIKKIQKACKITSEAIRYGFERIKPGMTEKKLAGIIYTKMFEMGATDKGFLAVYAGGERMIWADALPSDYRIEKGDLIMVDGGCIVDGYRADVSRMASVGKPSAFHQKLYDIAVEAHKAVVKKIGNNKSISEACLAGKQIIIDSGYESHLVFGGGQTGHGLGLVLHELPDLRVDSKEYFKSGMVLAIEPALTDEPGWNNSNCFFILENNYVVTKDGADILTLLSEEMWIA